ncbi:MAG: maleylpyruvate isomerase N-terminal domain-containing protein [Anaerolineae bacterium]
MVDQQALGVENTASLEELRTFCATLSPSDLLKPMPAEWTVASVLAHVAFWDLRAEALFRRYRREGFHPSAYDADPINDATRPLFRLIPPEEAVTAVIKAAEGVNAALQALDPALVEQLGTLAAETVSLDRADHRREHIEEIRTALGR